MDDNDKTVVVEERDVEARSSSSGPIVAIVALVVLIVLAIVAYNMLAGDGTTTDTTTGNEVTAPVEGGGDVGTTPDVVPQD